MVITNDQMLLPSALSAMVLVMLVLLMMEYLLRGISPLLIYLRLCLAPPVLPAVPDNVQNNTTTSLLCVHCNGACATLHFMILARIVCMQEVQGREEGMEGKQRYDGRRGGSGKEVTNGEEEETSTGRSETSISHCVLCSLLLILFHLASICSESNKIATQT